MRKLGTALLMIAAVALASPPEASAATNGEFNKYKVKRIVSKNKCFKCHAIKRKKVGPAYRDVSKRYNEDPEGREKIYKHLTTSPTIEVEGREETHVNLKTRGDKDIQQVISWLLSLSK
jgi:cytochrome c